MTVRSIRIEDTATLIQVLQEQKISPLHKVVISDELHQRKQALPISEKHLEKWVQQLSTSHIKAIIGRFNEFSLATIHLILAVRADYLRAFKFFVEMEGRGQSSIALTDISENFDEIETLNGFLWNEYAEDWVSIKKLTHWKGAVNFQFAPISKPSEQYDPLVEQAASKPSSVLPFLVTLISVVLVPFWFVMIFIALIKGFDSFLGPLLPTVFSLFMFIISIPMAIGLAQKKKWAWGVLTITAFFGVVWFGGNVLIDGAGKIWLMLALLEGIILTLALTAKDAFA